MKQSHLPINMRHFFNFKQVANTLTIILNPSCPQICITLLTLCKSLHSHPACYLTPLHLSRLRCDRDVPCRTLHDEEGWAEWNSGWEHCWRAGEAWLCDPPPPDTFLNRSKHFCLLLKYNNAVYLMQVFILSLNKCLLSVVAGTIPVHKIGSLYSTSMGRSWTWLTYVKICGTAKYKICKVVSAMEKTKQNKRNKSVQNTRKSQDGDNVILGREPSSDIPDEVTLEEQSTGKKRWQKAEPEWVRREGQGNGWWGRISRIGGVTVVFTLRDMDSQWRAVSKRGMSSDPC